MNRQEILKRMAQVVFFIFLVNTIAKLLYWYTSVWWFDMPMHFLGGVFLGFLAVYLYFPILELSFTRQFLHVFFGVLLIGVGWEVFEIIFNNVIAGSQFILLDTVSDICFDLAGGLVSFLFIVKKQQKIV